MSRSWLPACPFPATWGYGLTVEDEAGDVVGEAVATVPDEPWPDSPVR